MGSYIQVPDVEDVVCEVRMVSSDEDGNAGCRPLRGQDSLSLSHPRTVDRRSGSNNGNSRNNNSTDGIHTRSGAYDSIGEKIGRTT